MIMLKCYSCKKEINTGKSCEDCRKRHKLDARKRVKEAKKKGMCVSCYNRPAQDNCTSCTICLNSRQRYGDKDIRQILLTQAKTRSKKKNIEITITIEDIVIPEVCPILGIKLQKNRKHCEANSYSLDRIDSSKGYVKGNVQVISHRANQLKNDATIEEIKLLLKFLEGKKLYEILSP